MNLQEKYTELIASKGENMMQILTALTPEEKKYINAKIIVQYLEKDLENLDSNHPWRDDLYIKKQISDWNELIHQLESKQNLASC